MANAITAHLDTRTVVDKQSASIVAGRIGIDDHLLQPENSRCTCHIGTNFGMGKKSGSRREFWKNVCRGFSSGHFFGINSEIGR